MSLCVTCLRCGYDGQEVLHGVTMDVRANETVAVLGRNGSGKSTLLRAICGIVRPTSGTIALLGQDITGKPTSQVLQAGLAFVPQGHRVFPNLTVTENLRIAGSLVKDRGERSCRIEALMDRFPVLATRAKDKAGTLSGGQQQILGLARALMLRPKVMLVDEPSLGVDARTLDVIRDSLANLSRSGLAIVLVEQNLDFACALAGRAYVLEDGAIAEHGDVADIRAKLSKTIEE